VVSPFQGCRDRIERAYAHRKALGEIWNKLVNENFYQILVNVEHDGTGTISVEQLNPLPVSCALELGETLYNFRAALDGCIYRAAIIESKQNPPPGENRLEFPVCSNAAEFLKSARKIEPLSQKCRDFIESIQPYHTPELPAELYIRNFNRNLGILHDWARKDRHRQLHVVGCWGSQASPSIRLPAGTSLKSIRACTDGFLEYEHEIASFEIDGFVPGMKVQANPDLMIDIAVNETPKPCADNDTLGNRLTYIGETVEVTVCTIEHLCS